MLLDRPLAIVDLETTGAHPVNDRITEIAVYLIDHGQLTRRWTSLINPGIPLSDKIQQFTGITDAMVATAPSFADVHAELHELLRDRLLVAHNVRFDYGFLHSEFLRVGITFDAEVLCTVKLSRKLYPQHTRHGLDALIERYQLPCDARHRAEGDTQALWAYLQIIRDAFPADSLQRCLEAAMQPANRAPGLPPGLLEGMPDVPGVYALFDQHGKALFVGRASSLRSRVLGHFAKKGNPTDNRIAKETAQAKWEACSGELGASLLELSWLRELQPSLNRQSRDSEDPIGVYLNPRSKGSVLERLRLQGTDPTTWPPLLAMYRNKRDADNHLREMASLYQLCLKHIGIESGSGACSAHGHRRCSGVCVGRDSPEQHDQRLLRALQSRAPKPWPSDLPDGLLLIEETHPASGLSHTHAFRYGCYLGSYLTGQLPATTELAQHALRFDWEIWRLLQIQQRPAH